MTDTRPTAAAGGPVPDGRRARRPDALSRTRIVQAAIELLDTGGEQALTVRTLTDHLRTGRGAIYHHVSGLPDLLAAAAEDVVVAATPPPDGGGAPDSAVRGLVLGIFDAICAHPWVGAQLGRDPSQPAVLRIWTTMDRALRELGITGRQRSDAGAALAQYLFGAAAQHAAAGARGRDPEQRRAYLDTLAATWIRFDDGAADAAAHLREHDDREQFAAGLEIFLRGVRPGTT